MWNPPDGGGSENDAGTDIPVKEEASRRARGLHARSFSNLFGKATQLQDNFRKYSFSVYPIMLLCIGRDGWSPAGFSPAARMGCDLNHPFDS